MARGPSIRQACDMMNEPPHKPTGSDAPRHAWVDHTSEVCVRLHAPSLPELVAEAARAFAELVPEHMGATEAGERRTFRLDPDDDTATLVGWLNDLVYLAEVERWIPSHVTATWDDRATSTGQGARGIRVTARGRTLDRPFVLVKAATLHGAGVRAGDRGLEAEVTLDT